MPTDSYTPHLLSALRSRSFGDAADLIEAQAAEIARLRKIERSATDYLIDRNDNTEAELLSALLNGGIFDAGTSNLSVIKVTVVDSSIIKDVMLEDGR